jgi:hypothetical protein
VSLRSTQEVDSVKFSPKRVMNVKRPGTSLPLVWLVASVSLYAGPGRAVAAPQPVPQEPPAAAASPFVWRTATPESLGMSSPKLDALRYALSGSDSFCVRRATLTTATPGGE